MADLAHTTFARPAPIPTQTLTSMDITALEALHRVVKRTADAMTAHFNFPFLAYEENKAASHIFEAEVERMEALAEAVFDEVVRRRPATPDEASLRARMMAAQAVYGEDWREAIEVCLAAISPSH